MIGQSSSSGAAEQRRGRPASELRLCGLHLRLLLGQGTALVRDHPQVVRRNRLPGKQARGYRQDAHQRDLIRYATLEHKGVDRVVLNVATEDPADGDVAAADRRYGCLDFLFR